MTQAVNLTITNGLQTAVEIHWNNAGQLKKYHTLQPSQSVNQPSFFGHTWVAIDTASGGQIASKTIDKQPNDTWDLGYTAGQYAAVTTIRFSKCMEKLHMEVKKNTGYFTCYSLIHTNKSYNNIKQFLQYDVSGSTESIKWIIKAISINIIMTIWGKCIHMTVTINCMTL
ncbi:hypothetical protein BC833DRAFT_660267 [Globomyces pollinis-pini]|nr:hypothetical protein BC833DRAFT_660267 [Globomyces pollinis-pini]